ncbi:MAG: transposase [Clostridia bacterium]
MAQRYAEYLYLKTYDELQANEKYNEAFGILWDIIDQYTNGKKDKIVSVVDPDAKIAHKSPGNIKRGYKDHIIVDEDSEIILASVQTPFNVGDEKKFVELIEFEEASNKKFKAERRFAAMVRNQGLRRCRYLGMSRAKIHITLANMACNIVRMVNLLCQPSLAASQN